MQFLCSFTEFFLTSNVGIYFIVPIVLVAASPRKAGGKLERAWDFLNASEMGSDNNFLASLVFPGY